MINTTSLRAVLATALFVAVSNITTAVTTTVSTLANLNTALSTVSPGDTIVIADGTYIDWNITVPADRDGTPGNMITLRPESPGGVTFKSGPDTLDTDKYPIGSYIVIKADYFEVTGFKFDRVQGIKGHFKNVIDFNGASYSRLTQCLFIECGESEGAHVVRMYGGATHNIVAYNELINTMGQGIGVSDIFDEAIHLSPNIGNYIHHNHLSGVGRSNGVEGDYNGNEPIQLGQHAYIDEKRQLGAKVEYNLLENMTWGRCDPEIISVKSKSTISHNTIRVTDSRFELTLRYANDCTVEGNFVIGAGIRVYGARHAIINNFIINPFYGIDLPGAGDPDGPVYPTTEDNLIANNTIVEPTGRGTSPGRGISLWGQNPQDTLTDITVKNNLIIGSDAGSTLYFQNEGATSITYEGNIGWAGTGVTLSSVGFLIPVTSSDPGLVPDGELRRLPSGASTAKGAGVAEALITRDMDGQPRGSGALDVGADRYVSGRVVNRPLVAADVGPAWTGGPPVTPFTDDLLTSHAVIDLVAVPATSVSASADDGAGNVAANATDASMTSRWSGPGDGVTLSFDLGATYTVKNLDISTHLGTTRRTAYHVEVSNDNVNWAYAAGSVALPLFTDGDELTDKLDIADVRARYIKIVGHGNTENTFTSLTDVKIYGQFPTLTAIADAYATNSADPLDTGAPGILKVKDASVNTFDRISYIKFDLSKLTFTPSSATLVLTTASATEAGTVTVKQCATDTWTEAGLTWSNKPAPGAAIINASVPAGSEAYIPVVVTSYVNAEYAGAAPKQASFALTGMNALLLFKSRETGSDAPTLVLTR